MLGGKQNRTLGDKKWQTMPTMSKVRAESTRIHPIVHSSAKRADWLCSRWHQVSGCDEPNISLIYW